MAQIGVGGSGGGGGGGGEGGRGGGREGGGRRLTCVANPHSSHAVGSRYDAASQIMRWTCGSGSGGAGGGGRGGGGSSGITAASIINLEALVCGVDPSLLPHPHPPTDPPTNTPSDLLSGLSSGLDQSQSQSHSQSHQSQSHPTPHQVRLPVVVKAVIAHHLATGVRVTLQPDGEGGVGEGGEGEGGGRSGLSGRVTEKLKIEFRYV
jgi:hypothetical protein